MAKDSEINKPFFGANVRRLRKHLGLSQYTFALFLEISLKTLSTIENEKSKVKIETARLIRNKFSMYTLDDLCENPLEIPEDLRQQLVEKIKVEREDLVIYLSTPKLIDAINGKLLNSVFFHEYREIKHIKIFFQSLGWFYDGSSISLALKRLSEKGSVNSIRQKGKKNIFLYRSK
jgi:DNA-binding XRE family transcriptional regulator